MRCNVYYGPSPRNDGSPFLLHQALRRIVHTTKYECHGDPRLFAKADLHVAVDWAEDIWPTSRDFIEPRPLVYWMSDTHCSATSKWYRFTKAKRADFVYCAIRDNVAELASEGVKATWLPYAAEPLCFTTWDTEQKHDVGFVGHIGDYPGRIEFLDAMFKTFPNFHFEYNRYLELCALEMRKSKVALNHVWANATNMRVFEAMATGVCLLTPATPDLADLGIVDGVNCLTYTTTEEAIEKTRAILKDEDKRVAIAKEGRTHILKHHTYVHRALTILRDATGLPWDVDVKKIIETVPGEGKEWGEVSQRLPQTLPI